MAPVDQILVQGLEIIDLAIEDDPNRSVLVRHGLVSTGEVDNTQAVEGQADVASQIDSVVVRPAMPGDFAHPVDNIFLHAPGGIEIEEPANSAHDGMKAGLQRQRSR